MGLAAAWIGSRLEARGLRVTLQKMDPYINVDAGTMSPYQHGEVFVTDDGGETDLDLGHYERFTSGRVTRDHNVTTGKVYFSVIQKERRGDYLGRTVQVIPHITDEIKASIRRVARDTDVVIVEVGGTVGDIEGLPFLEAIRQFKKDVGRENVIYVHLTLVPFMQAASELKTKATQHSVKELRAIGIQPDILLCRTDRYLPPGIKSKIALFCDVEEEAVITAKDVETIYEVPLVFHKEGLDEIVTKLLGLEPRPCDLSRWEAVVRRVKSPRAATRVAVVGKYIDLKDSYKSLIEALAHGGIANEARVDIQWVDAEHDRRKGRDDAPRPLSERARRGQPRLTPVRAGDHSGAAPPPVRGQQRLRPQAREAWAPHLGDLGREAARRDHRDSRAPVLRGRAVPPRVPLAALGPAPTLRRLHPGRAGACGRMTPPRRRKRSPEPGPGVTESRRAAPARTRSGDAEPGRTSGRPPSVEGEHAGLATTEPPRTSGRPPTVEGDHAGPATTEPPRTSGRPPSVEGELAAPATIIPIGRDAPGRRPPPALLGGP